MPRKNLDAIKAEMPINSTKEQIKANHMGEIAKRLKNGETLTAIVEDIYKREYQNNGH